MTTRVIVAQVNIPAMSTIGFGDGIDEQTGEPVRFTGDHRPMRDLGEAIMAARANGDSAPIVELEDWQLIG